jgi:L-ascorbate metabolism protein UlaG (beta-lactamase superfamily)
MGTSFSGLRLERMRASRQFRDGAFKNSSQVTPGLKGNPLPLLGEYFFGDKARVPRVALPVDDPRARWTRPVETGLRVTWLGHSTLLLEVGGRRVLTDPVFGERASPFSFAGPRRFHPTPVRLDELPPLDAVLLSHDHYDHLCKATMTALAKGAVPVVTSLGVGAHLEALGWPRARIHELDWGESLEVGGVRFSANPAQHFSGRGLHDRNSTLWSSWVLEAGARRLFFSGDTGLTEEFKGIAARHGPFDLVLLEVGAWHHAWGDIHLGPKNALIALDWLGGGTLLPVHWGTFNLALHAWDEPAETLLQRAHGRRIITPPLGSPVEPERLDGPTPWWREVAKAPAPAPVPDAG